MDIEVTFKDVLGQYDNLSTIDKHEENIKELKELLALTNKLCTDVGSDKKFELDKSALNIKNKSTDEYLKAEYAYINEIKNYLGSFVETIADSMYE
jgi:hypothetical protein